MEPVQIANILVGPDRLAELDGTQVVNSVSRESFSGGEIVAARERGFELGPAGLAP